MGDCWSERGWNPFFLSNDFFVLLFSMYCSFVLNFQGQRLMMMGTADEIVKAPEKGPVFVEDLPEEEQVVAVVWFLDLSLESDCF